MESSEGQDQDQCSLSPTLSQFIAPKQSRKVYTSVSVDLIQTKEYMNVNKIWVWDLMNDSILDVQNCHDPEQTADVLMTGLPKPKHTQHVKEMGIQLIVTQ